MNRLALALIAALCLSLPSSAPATAADEEPSFKNDVQPFLTKYCVQCHGDMKPKAGIRLDSFDGMMNKSKKKAVVAGKPDQSKLIQSLTGKGAKPMPPKKSPAQPSAGEIDKVKAWVKAGAKDDSK